MSRIKNNPRYHPETRHPKGWVEGSRVQILLRQILRAYNPTLTLRMTTALLLSVLFLSACAQAPLPLQFMGLLPPEELGISESKNNLTVTLFSLNTQDAERKDLYEDLSKNGILPLQIQISNLTGKTFSFEKVQYAITDPDFKRIWKSQAKELSLENLGVFSEGPEGKGRKQSASRLRKEFMKFELLPSQILPNTTQQGWLYFKIKDGNFNLDQLLKDYQAHKLEIAHIKDLETNIVSTTYLELKSLSN